MIELALNKLQKYYGANMVLEDVTFDIQTSEKVGIVGENGCGKSTLLKILMGIEEHESGTISIKKNSTLGYLEQMPVYPEGFKVIDVLNIAFDKIDKLQKEMEVIEKQLTEANEANMEKLLNSYSKVQTNYESLGGYEKEEKLSKVCVGLKIDEEFKNKLFTELSGGEKTTVILGKILLQNPDILLLDEPSNHLDLETMEWLEAYLKEYKGIVIIVSHDRYFLDNVVTKIIEIEDMKAKSYDGNYTAFVNEKDRQLKLQMEVFLDQQKKIKAIEKSIAQLREWGKNGDNTKFFKRAASMEKMLNKLERVNKPVMERQNININVNTGERSGDNVVIVKELYKSYEEKVLFNKADLLVRNKERVALIGANGCGKSTLIKILLGNLEADKGTATLGSSIKLGYLPQNVVFEDEDKTILETFREDIVITDGKAREYLARYMFFGEMVFKKVGALSGGERSRLKLAILMYKEVNLLILDEPTNHLDIASREELEEFLKDFEGTLLFVSHDRYFINNIANKVVELSGGALNSYNGNYEYYKEKIAQLKSVEEVKIIPKEENKITKAKKEKVSNNAKSNNEFKKLKLEEKIGELEEKLKGIEEEINKFCDDYEKLDALYKEKMDLQKQLEELMEEYFS
ncbi:ribosomal protection-like ABC-F family protein [Clostridium saccharoperbutylacetonicum]|uniref:ribosomal protection-like ABC-F family protein n=1 Tax=Clostridium saccharoperbutylacetonicum TaxID=36745 RepID=UPI00098401B2|nr:ABC-F type ribosomal protection protein [Clostridium saccharoperbutylacetonicum]AQR98152.1 putative ABC transporter ATP-binding protein YheS [Clostridium saccharoperbutylacetonicum]NSB34046.1 ATPase subunit of ABC transporter with duplicated ATPase domains [Clostridium saccharoperbutylacetonicum]